MLKSLETLLLRYSRPLLFLSTPVIFFVELVVALFRALLLRSVNVLLVAFRAHWMEARGDLLMEDYASSGDGLVLKRAIKLYEGALGLRPTGDNRRSVLLLDLGAALRRFCTEQLADAARLTQAIMLHREALELLPPGHLSRPRALDGLATILLASFEQFGSLGDVTEAIEALREAMVLYPYADRNRSFLLTNLAYALWVHFRQLGDMSVLAEAIDLDREALALRRPGDSSRCSSLSNLASALIARFEKQGDSPSLAEAIDLQREAAYTCPIGDPARPVFLGNLATALLVRFEQDGDCNLIAEAVELSRQALKLCPAGHPDRSMSLTSLANALMYRFNREGDVQAVAEAICLYRQALILRPLGHPERSVTMDSLAGALLARFKQDEDMEALTEALTLRRGASDLLPRGNLNRAASLNNLAITLMALFKQNGDLEALAEATNLHRQALELRPPGHSESVRAGSLDNLAIALRARFATQGDIEALEEAISLHREALRLFPPNHPEYDSALTCLANALSMSFELHGEPEKLEEAIALHRQALHRRPPEHPGYSILLNNLASALQLRHDQRNDALAEAITLNRQALDLRPPPNPSRALTLANLGNALRAQYLQAFTTEAFEEDLALAREGLNICPYGHPMRQRFLFAVAGCLLLPGTAQFDFDAGVCHIKEALKDECSPARERLGRMVSASGALEVAHRFVGRDNGSSGSRQMLRDEAVLHVYVSSVQLLSRVADFGLDHASRLRELAGVETLSRNAAVFAIGTRREGDAVEMLEEGRGVFWSQALRLHGSGLELLSMDDQRELQRLFQVLESGSHQETLMSPAQRDRKIEERRRLSKKAESLIANIRSRPGMERFLLPPAFSSLLQSLPSTGFVVMLIDSQHGHRALLMERSNTRAMSIELSSPAGGFLSKAVQASLPRDGAARPLFSLDAQTVRAFGISKSRMRIKNSKACEPLENTLAEIWTTIVKPVIVALRLQVCINYANKAEG
jgi:tetratricopeptide (TPR) repeat protein